MKIMRTFVPGYSVLEVGCGTGNVLQMLDEASVDGVVIGMDLFGEALHFARQRSDVPLLQADVHHPPFRTEINLVGLFDVLEHLPDDVQVLRDIHSMLSDDGRLILTVPGYPSLWSYFDEASHHCRRYRPEELLLKLADAGYNVEFFTPFMLSLFPLLWLVRRVAGFFGRANAPGEPASKVLATNELRIRPVVNQVLLGLLRLETLWLASGRTLPFGTSLLIVASKR